MTIEKMTCSLLIVFAVGTLAHGDEPKPTPPPEGAIVLFDGKSLDGWITQNRAPAKWKVQDGYMEVVSRTGSIMTEKEFGPDVQVHVEFWLPLMADKKGQDRANSGVYVLGRWEVQVLDSYMNETYSAGGCGSLYKLIAPSKNAIKPPEQWNTYDITLHAPRTDASGKVTQKGRLTVVHNGILTIDNAEFDQVTFGGLDTKLAMKGPLWLQDHGNKVRFRNIWIKPLESK